MHENLWIVTFDAGRWGIKQRSYCARLHTTDRQAAPSSRNIDKVCTVALSICVASSSEGAT